MALVPLFAVWETARVLGEGRYYELFFRRAPDRERDAGSTGPAPAAAAPRQAPHRD